MHYMTEEEQALLLLFVLDKNIINFSRIRFLAVSNTVFHIHRDASINLGGDNRPM